MDDSKNVEIDDMRTEIIVQLMNLEQEYNIKILYAVECGSRAYRLESETSDYDVRFIYRNNNILSYIHLDGARPQNINKFTLGRFIDFQGWNVDKTLKHLGQGNCSLFEWCHSSIIYIDDSSGFVDSMRSIFRDPVLCEPLVHSYKGQFLSHYYKFVNPPKGFLNKDTTDNAFQIKKYVHCVRPLIMCLYLNQCFQSGDPLGRSSYTIDVVCALDKLCDEYNITVPRDKIKSLLDMKRFGVQQGNSESPNVSTQIVLHDDVKKFIEDNVAFNAEYPSKDTNDNIKLQRMTETLFEAQFSKWYDDDKRLAERLSRQ